MKVTISLPDDLLAKVDELAESRGVSRSSLMVEAIEHYFPLGSKSSITDQINRVCEKVDTTMDPVLLEMSLRSINSDER